jgi:hypothetical protein
MMLGIVRNGIALALLVAAVSAAPPAYAADPLSPEASAFKAEGIPDCVSKYLYRGTEYEAAQAQCECVFDFYARHLTPKEMSDVSAMSKVVRVTPGDRNNPVVIAGANALMRVSPELMQSCKFK